MSKTRELDSLKRKVYLAYHRDGVLDLVAGSVVSGFGLYMLTENIAFLISCWLVMMFYMLLKQRITIPRFGYVGFESKERSLKMGWLAMGIGVVVVLGLFIGNFFVDIRPGNPEMQAMLKQYYMVPLSAFLFGIPSLLAAMILGLKRYYLYFGLLVVLPALAAWLGIMEYIPILTSGLVMLVTGLGLLVSFLRKYPLTEEAETNVEG